MDIVDTVLFPVADALDLPLHELPGGVVKGAGSKVLKAGPWMLMADMVVCSDSITPTTSGFLVRMYRNLWVYMVVGVKFSKSTTPVVAMLFFDGNQFGVKPKDIATFGEKDIPATIEKIRGAVSKVAVFDNTSKNWKVYDASAVEHITT